MKGALRGEGGCDYYCRTLLKQAGYTYLNTCAPPHKWPLHSRYIDRYDRYTVVGRLVGWSGAPAARDHHRCPPQIFRDRCWNVRVSDRAAVHTPLGRGHCVWYFFTLPYVAALGTNIIG
jgi:hypothetical protein